MKRKLDDILSDGISTNPFGVNLVKLSDFLEIKIATFQLVFEWINHACRIESQLNQRVKKLDDCKIVLMMLEKVLLGDNNFDLFIVSTDIIQGLAVCSLNENKEIPRYTLRLLLTAPWNAAPSPGYLPTKGVGTALLSAIVQRMLADPVLNSLPLVAISLTNSSVGMFYLNRMFMYDGRYDFYKLKSDTFAKFLKKWLAPERAKQLLLVNNKEFLFSAKTSTDYYFIYRSRLGDATLTNKFLASYFEVEPSEKTYSYDDVLFKNLLEYIREFYPINNWLDLIVRVINDPVTSKAWKALAFARHYELFVGMIEQISQLISQPININFKFTKIHELEYLIKAMIVSQFRDKKWMQAMHFFLTHLVDSDVKHNFIKSNYETLIKLCEELNPAEVQEICDLFGFPSVSDLKTTYFSYSNISPKNNFKPTFFKPTVSETSLSLITDLKQNQTGTDNPAAQTLLKYGLK